MVPCPPLMLLFAGQLGKSLLTTEILRVLDLFCFSISWVTRQWDGIVKYVQTVIEPKARI
jgi:hypothetical protein